MYYFITLLLMGGLLAACIFACITIGELFAKFAFCGIAIFLLLLILDHIQKHREAKGRKSKKSIPWGVFAIIYIVFFISIIVIGITVSKLIDRANSEKTTATISEITERIEKEKVEDSDGSTYERDKTVCDMKVKYIVDGKEYNEEYKHGANCNKKKGQKVTIYYRKDNPRKIHTTSDLLLLIAGSIVCLIASFAVIMNLVNSHKENKKKRNKKNKKR